MGDTLKRVGMGVATGGASELNPLVGAGANAAVDKIGGGSGGKKSSPAPPDFGALADKQTAANRPDQSNPFGSTTWDPTHQKQTTNFAGPLADASGSLQDQYAKANASPLDNGQQARTAATNAVYGQEASRLDPQWTQRGQAVNADLANAGLDPTGEAGGKVMDQFNRGRNDAYSSAQRQAITMGGDQAAQQQQLDLNSRQAPLAGMQGLRGLLQMPGVGQAGDQLSAGKDQFGANMQQFDANGGALGGWGQLLGALMPLLKAGGRAAGSPSAAAPAAGG